MQKENIPVLCVQIYIMEKKQEKNNGFFIVAEMLDAITSTSTSSSCSNLENR